jgi:hypothetical protein
LDNRDRSRLPKGLGSASKRDSRAVFAIFAPLRATFFAQSRKERKGKEKNGLQIDGQRKIIRLLRIMHRRDIYRHFP